VRIVNLIVIVLLFLVLQVVVAPRITFADIGPDFPLLLMAYFAVTRQPQHGAFAGFLIGLIQDLFNPALLGLNALTKTLAGYALGMASAKIEPESSLLLFPLFGVTALAHDVLYLLFFTGLDLGQFFTLLFTVALPSALYTAVVGVVVYKLADALTTRMVRSVGKARS
jgi:rod shape-determining protein MreD